MPYSAGNPLLALSKQGGSIVFEDFSDFSSKNWNGWVPGEDTGLDFRASGSGLEIPWYWSGSPPPPPIKHTLLEKTYLTLEPGRSYEVQVVLLLRKIGVSQPHGVQNVRFKVDGQLLEQMSVTKVTPQKLTSTFVAERAQHTISLLYEHVPGVDEGHGDFHLDDLELLVGPEPGQENERLDWTDFESDEDPFNGWVPMPHGEKLEVLGTKEGGHYIGYPEKRAQSVLGSVLEKQVTLPERAKSCVFRLRARKAGFNLRRFLSLEVTLDGEGQQPLAMWSIDRDTYQWTFTPKSSQLQGHFRIIAREGLASTTQGLEIDSLLVRNVDQDVK